MKCKRKGSGDTTIPNQFFTHPVAGESSKVGSSSKDEPAGATKDQPWTRVIAVESAEFIAERLRP